MDVGRNTGNAFKKALDRRQTGSLPSNFSYRMMEQIRMEAARQNRKRQRIMILSLSAALSVIVGLLAYFMFFYLEIRWSDLMPDVSLASLSSPLFGFYTYIALLALGLLGVDYWIRKKKSILDE